MSDELTTFASALRHAADHGDASLALAAPELLILAGDAYAVECCTIDVANGCTTGQQRADCGGHRHRLLLALIGALERVQRDRSAVADLRAYAQDLADEVGLDEGHNPKSGDVSPGHNGGAANVSPTTRPAPKRDPIARAHAALHFQQENPGASLRELAKAAGYRSKSGLTRNAAWRNLMEATRNGAASRRRRGWNAKDAEGRHVVEGVDQPAKATVSATRRGR